MKLKDKIKADNELLIAKHDEYVSCRAELIKESKHRLENANLVHQEKIRKIEESERHQLTQIDRMISKFSAAFQDSPNDVQNG